MKKRKLGSSTSRLLAAALLSLAGSLAFAAPMKPELAAKKEMVRKQQEQRALVENRQAAADWLKAERLKVFQARQAARKSHAGSNK